MLARCDRINRCLARENADLRVIGFYRHTGNLVLKTTRLQLTQAAQILSQITVASIKWTMTGQNSLRIRPRAASFALCRAISAITTAKRNESKATEDLSQKPFELDLRALCSV